MNWRTHKVAFLRIFIYYYIFITVSDCLKHMISKMRLGGKFVSAKSKVLLLLLGLIIMFQNVIMTGTSGHTH